jgi:hypothetical protein
MEAKNYIVEISRVEGDETSIYLEDDDGPVDHLFAIVSIAERGACIVDNCYRTIDEAQLMWPNAIPPKPHHLSPIAIDRHFTIKGTKDPLT